MSQNVNFGLHPITSILPIEYQPSSTMLWKLQSLTTFSILLVFTRQIVLLTFYSRCVTFFYIIYIVILLLNCIYVLYLHCKLKILLHLVTRHFDIQYHLRYFQISFDSTVELINFNFNF